MLKFLGLLAFFALHWGKGAPESLIACSGDHSEPTLLDILDHVLPIDIKHTTKLWYDQIEKIDNSGYAKVGATMVEAIMNLKLPLSSVIQDGEYTVHYDRTSHLFTFNDVYFVQRRNIFMKFLCKYGQDLMFVSTACSMCETTEQLGHNRHPWVQSKVPADGSYCVEKAPCTDKSYKDGFCRVTSDPFSSTCVYIDADIAEGISHPSSDDVGTAATPDENSRNQSSWQKVPSNIIHYQTVMPTVQDTWDKLRGITRPRSTSTLANADTKPRAPNSVESATLGNIWIDWSSAASDKASLILSIIPYYYFNFLLGWLIISNAADLTDSIFVQLHVQALYGLLLAFVLILFWGYR